MDYTNFMIAVFFMILSNVLIAVSRSMKKIGLRRVMSVVAYVTLIIAVLFVFRAFFT